MEADIVTLFVPLFVMACGVIGTLIVLNVFWPDESKKFRKSVRHQK